ncbi:hypothetical protein [Rufibacter latericius]|nr:hypothetical protein [Rufibacter latericius]
MQATFTRLLLSLLISVPLCFISCGDEDQDPLETKKTQENSCQVVTNETVLNGVSIGLSQITYNSQGYVTKMEIREGLANQSPTVSSRVYVYNGQNLLVRINYTKGEGQEESYTTFEYNADGTISRETNYKGTTLYWVSTYTYDANKRMIQQLRTMDGSTNKFIYEYAGDSQNISKETYYVQNGTAVSGYRVYSNYDDKLNPVFMVKGLPLNGESRNNPAKEVYTSSDGQSTLTDTYSYKYNTSGAVTEIIRKASWSQTEYKSLFTYTCN